MENGNEELFEKRLYQVLHSDYNLIAESIGADGFQAKTSNWAPEYNDFLLQVGEAIWYNDAQGLGELLMVHARNYVETYVRGWYDTSIVGSVRYCEVGMVGRLLG